MTNRNCGTCGDHSWCNAGMPKWVGTNCPYWHARETVASSSSSLFFGDKTLKKEPAIKVENKCCDGCKHYYNGCIGPEARERNVCLNWAPKEDKVEKTCETCRYRNDVTKHADKCSLCTGRYRQVVLKDNYEPALPEKSDGLSEQEAMIAYYDGWAIEFDHRIGTFECPNGFDYAVSTFKITGRREGK